MRDFNSGDIRGDVNINDSSKNNEYKLLINCTNEELRQEEFHRQALLSDELSRKNRVTLKFLGIAAVLFLTAAGWYWFKGAIDIASLVVGVAGVLVALATLQAANKPTGFEQRQLATLLEIRTLLRERGAR